MYILDWIKEILCCVDPKSCSQKPLNRLNIQLFRCRLYFERNIYRIILTNYFVKNEVGETQKFMHLLSLVQKNCPWQVNSSFVRTDLLVILNWFSSLNRQCCALKYSLTFNQLYCVSINMTPYSSFNFNSFK